MNGTDLWTTAGQYKILLTSNTGGGYTFNAEDASINTITGGGTNYELSGTGYVAGPGGTGRKTMTTCAVSIDSTNHRVRLTADNLTWTALNAGTIDKLIIYRHTSNSADTSNYPLICVDVTDLATNGSDVAVTWDSAGIATW